MRALPFQQPWAHACLHWGKRIDNRQRSDGSMPPVMRHRGLLLLHASQPPSKKKWVEAMEWMAGAGVIEGRVALWHQAQRPSADRPNPFIPCGGIVGIASVCGVVRPSGAFETSHVTNLDLRWHMRGQFGAILQWVLPLPFMPYKGGRSLFTVPDEVVLRWWPKAFYYEGGVRLTERAKMCVARGEPFR